MAILNSTTIYSNKTFSSARTLDIMKRNSSYKKLLHFILKGVIQYKCRLYWDVKNEFNLFKHVVHQVYIHILRLYARSPFGCAEARSVSSSLYQLNVRDLRLIKFPLSKKMYERQRRLAVYVSKQILFVSHYRQFLLCFEIRNTRPSPVHLHTA